MRLVTRSVLPVSLLLFAAGLVASACGPATDDPFPRGGTGGGGGHGDDDDEGHGAPEDRWAYWDLVRSAPFGAGAVEITAKASFFEEGGPLAWPQPEALGQCISGSLDDDPHEPPPSVYDFGGPSMFLDGEDWELERATTEDLYSRVLPERVWAPFELVRLSVPGTELYPATSWEEALSIPDTLVGTSATLTQDGLELEWEGGVAENQLRLVISSTNTGRYEYIVCLPGDGGSFTVPAENMLDGFEGYDVQVGLQRETIRDEIGIDADRVGTAVGISALRAEFSIADDFWTGGDDDDSAR